MNIGNVGNVISGVGSVAGLFETPRDNTVTSVKGGRASSIDQFIATINKRGVAVKNRYQLVIPTPHILQTHFNANFKSLPNLLNMYCKDVELPDITLATQPMKIFGEDVELPHQRTYSTMPIVFYSDAGLIIKNFFEEWINNIITPDSNTSNYLFDFASDIDIKVLHKSSTDNNSSLTGIVKHYILYEAYPKSISAVQLSSGDNTVMELTVIFAYKRWYSQQISKIDFSKDTTKIKSNPESSITKKISDAATGIKNGMAAIDGASNMLGSIKNNIGKGNVGGLLGTASLFSNPDATSNMTGGLFGTSQGTTSVSDENFADSLTSEYI